ncbi:MAG: PAS domain-containing protein [bacterium]
MEKEYQLEILEKKLIASENEVRLLRAQKKELEEDIEKRTKSRIILETVLRQYKVFYKISPVGFCKVTKDGIILNANLAFANLLIAKREDLLKKSIMRYIHFFFHLKIDSEHEIEPYEIEVTRQNNTFFLGKAQFFKMPKHSDIYITLLLSKDLSKKEPVDEISCEIEK